MSQITWIAKGHVMDPASGRNAIGDIFIRDDRLVASLSADEKASAKVIDASGHVVAPGFVDLHSHLREPGDTHKETIASGTQAAAAGGFTTLVCSSNTKPPADNTGTIQLLKDAIARDARVTVLPTGCITAGRQGERLAPLGSLKRAGIVAASDGGHCIQDNEIMRRAVEYAHMFGLVVFDRPEDAELTQDCQMNEGEWSLRLGLRGMHQAAEDVMVARDIVFAEHFQARIHLQSLSSEWSTDALRRARSRNIPITAEVTPHHLALTDAAVCHYNTNTKTVPPLRTESDRQALIAALVDGTIDCIATAHAPHTVTEKDVEYDYAPFGINGLETAFSVCYQALVQAGHCDLLTLVDCLTQRPAGVLGLDCGTLAEGAYADVVILDTQASWTPQENTFHSRSSNSPWLGEALPGRVRDTFHHGRHVHSLKP